MLEEKDFEDFLGVDTIENTGEAAKTGRYSIYEATHYQGLIRIFKELILTPYDTLVDFGCGLGRVLFYCNQLYMCHITGVEYDRDIYDRLQKNADAYCKRFKNQEKKILLLNMKAEEYIVEDRDNYFYFFNPFSPEVMCEVLDNIIVSYRHKKRRITFIFYYCTYEIMAVLRKYPISPEKILKLPGYVNDPDEKAYIYTIG